MRWDEMKWDDTLYWSPRGNSSVKGRGNKKRKDGSPRQTYPNQTRNEPNRLMQMDSATKMHKKSRNKGKKGRRANRISSNINTLYVDNGCVRGLFFGRAYCLYRCKFGCPCVTWPAEVPEIDQHLSNSKHVSPTLILLFIDYHFSSLHSGINHNVKK